MITVLKCEVGKEIQTIEIERGLKNMQKEVGGYIEQFSPFEDDVVLIVNEEGKLQGLPLNRAVYDEYSGEVIDVIAGDFLIVYAPRDGDDYENMPEHLVEKYSEKFKHPEEFYKIGGKIVAFPIQENREHDAR